MTESPALDLAVRVSNALLWLFTTSAGVQCLGLGLLLVFLVHLSKALKERSLLLAASGRKMGLTGFFNVTVQELVSVGALIAANVPILIGVVAMLSVVVALAGTVAKVDEFFSLQKKIREYSIVLKHLERRYKVARVECVAQKNGASTLLIKYYDQNGKPVSGSKERITIRGADIFIDALVINFTYSGIESGETRNLAFPYRVFSEKVAQRDGVRLKIAKSETIPYFFKRTERQVFGLDKKVFDARLTELLKLAEDAEAARSAGLVRSVYGNAVHKTMTKGDAFLIWVEQSGGLTIKEENTF